MIIWRNSFCSESETNYGTEDKVPPNVVAKRKVSFEIIGIYCISNVFFEVVWCVFWEYPIHIALLMVAVNRLFVSLLKSWTLYCYNNLQMTLWNSWKMQPSCPTKLSSDWSVGISWNQLHTKSPRTLFILGKLYSGRT